MIGIIISFCVGVFFGAFIMSVCAAAGRADRENDSQEEMKCHRYSE